MKDSSSENKWTIHAQTLKMPIILLVVFVLVAITLSVTLHNLFYLFNFLYIGISVATGIFLNSALPKKHNLLGRRIAQLMVGLYMLGYLGLIAGENMQIEGFWIYLVEGIFAGAAIHYLIAKVAGPFIFNRGWCGWACWTAMILDFLPYKAPQNPPKKKLGALRYLHFFLTIVLIFVVYMVLGKKETSLRPSWELHWLIIGNAAYYLIGIALAFILKDNRAFCKYICPIPVMMKVGARFSLMRIQIDPTTCIDCKLCEKNCPMDIKLLDYKNAGKRVSSTECILCNTCSTVCPTQAVSMNVGLGDKLKKVKPKRSVSA